MRRKDKEINDRYLIDEILKKAETLKLAMCSGNKPYVVSMNYVYDDDRVYLHSAMEGKKINLLKNNNNVAFQLEIDVSIVIGDEACGSGTKYKSVYGEGKVYFVEDENEKIRALDLIMQKYTGRNGCDYIEKIFDNTLIIKIIISKLTGKISGY